MIKKNEVGKAKKKGFLGRWLEKLDQQLVEKSQKSSCCGGSQNKKGSSCC